MVNQRPNQSPNQRPISPSLRQRIRNRMNKDEYIEQEEMIKDGLKFYLKCLEDPTIPHPEIKPRIAQYLHETYGIGVLRAITLSHRIQGRFANIQIDLNNIPW